MIRSRISNMGPGWLAVAVFFCGFTVAGPTSAGAADPAAAAANELPLVFEDDFEHGRDRWETIGGNWSLIAGKGSDDRGQVFRVGGKSSYNPPVTSPRNIALVKDLVVGDFELTADVQSTAKDYAHRDMCLIFGFQDPSHFYYVHLALRADDRANQVFVVNGEPRKKITVEGSAGTPWKSGWHKVRLVRRTADGQIDVYFDDLQNPIMTARDRTFVEGRMGLGTFDDEGNWDQVRLRGRVVTAPKPASVPPSR